MAKRKFRNSPAVVSVKMVKWVDARTAGMSPDDGRQHLDVDLPELWTAGMVIFEDERQYILASELEANDDYMNMSMRYIQIPKLWITEERTVGEARIYESEDSRGDSGGSASPTEPEAVTRTAVGGAP